jgi:predicted short-subunit dehydrogenase-like oxidoreductase (DUF2520 family)
MNIVIVGTGNVATVLGKKFRKAGHKILQVFGRNNAAAKRLAKQLKAESTSNWSHVRKDADVYLIAVSDNAIDDVATNLRVPGKVVAHTAASVKKNVLRKISAHYGVFYPLQSLRREMTRLPEIPLSIDAGDRVAKKTLRQLAQSISNETVSAADDNKRIKMHAAAVFVSNFTNHLYSLAEHFCKKEGIDFKELLPLIEETAQRLKTVSPSKVQTGPAIRYDDATIKKHLALLKTYPQLQKIYKVMTKSIKDGSTV